MPSASMSRRAFLAAGGGAFAARRVRVLRRRTARTGQPRGRPGAKGRSAFRMEIEPYVSTSPQRFAFILVDNNGDFAGGPTSQLAIAPAGREARRSDAGDATTTRDCRRAAASTCRADARTSPETGAARS